MYQVNQIKNKIFCGDSLEVLKQFPSNCIDLVVTSPPYYNLRNYHDKNQIGIEKTPKEYVNNLINIFRECKRVLKSTGSIWVNIADSYNSNIGELRNPGFSEKNNYKRLEHAHNVTSGINKNRIVSNIGKKSLIGIPERFCIAMQDELGLIRRNTVIWYKPSCMPQSVKDRFTIDFEYFYFFVKSNDTLLWKHRNTKEWTSIKPKVNLNNPKEENITWEWYITKNGDKNKRSLWKGFDYFFETQYEPMKTDVLKELNRVKEYKGTAQKDYSANGVQDPSDIKKRMIANWNKKRPFGGNKQTGKYASNQDSVTNTIYSGNNWIPNENLERIKRCVWTINTGNSIENHFASYPEELIEVPIKACTDIFGRSLVLDPFLGCYDKETEVLTNNGFKLFSELDKEKDLVSNIDDHYNLTFVKPIQYFKLWYKGQMYKVKHRSLELLVTPNHNIIFREHHKENQEIQQIQNIKYKWIYLPCKINTYKGIYNEWFELPIIEKGLIQVQRININLFIQFLGYYISEGYITKDHYQIGISQTKQHIRNNIKNILDQLPYSILNLNDRFKLNNKQLYQYLVKLGKQKDRYIPREFLMLSKEQIQLLFNSLMEGDGHKLDDGGFNYYTISKQLCNDVMELGIKLGYSVTYRSRIRNEISKIKGRNIKSDNIQYEIHLMKSNERKINSYTMITQENYNDYVYCVEVPDHRLIVRRNGKVCVCGNSGTTAIKAQKMGRNYVGIELNKDYVNITKRRLNSMITSYILRE